MRVFQENLKRSLCRNIEALRRNDWRPRNIREGARYCWYTSIEGRALWRRMEISCYRRRQAREHLAHGGGIGP